jgi:hypothetical protein
MQAAHNAQVAFYLTGQQADTGLGAIASLRPALFAYRSDLTALRYDFPLVLLRHRDDAASVQSLTALVDAALAAQADKPNADRLRHHAHALECELRRVLAEHGGNGRLGALRLAAMERLGAGSDRDMADSMRALAAALPNDAELLDCDRAMPGRVVAHLWEAAQRPRLRQMRAEIDRLTQKVADILDAAQARSDAGRTPEALRAAFGAVHAGVFDFVAFSRVLGRGAPAEGLPESRWRRLHWLLSVLQGQRFFPVGAVANELAYSFTFTSCFDALRAWRERLPKAVELVKAMAIAALEIEGEYDEARHDAVFASFGERGLDPGSLARFPAYLVLLQAAQVTPADIALALEAMDAGLPIKLLLQSDDILAPAALGDGACSLGIANRQLAGAAIASGNVFVMQASAAQISAGRDRLFAGLAAAGPALVSVYSGAGGQTDGIPAYLLAAAAVESRAFPSFVYDPAAGHDLASRFALDGNPQPGQDWPQYELSYQDALCQQVSETTAFTLVDFLACDRRFARDFARVTPAAWNADMVPVADCVARTASGSTVPCLLMLDAENRLHKVVADERLIRVARRCLGLWHMLQEQGGVHNSHVHRALAHARVEGEEATGQRQPAPAAAPATDSAAAAPVRAEVTAQEPTRSPDDAYIETPRCSTCEECIHINSKMFAYNNDKQAYIADITAGTFRQLVEAAESCQVAIIHPGQPRDKTEPGLQELVGRAAAFQ